MRSNVWLAWASAVGFIGCGCCSTPLQEFYQNIHDKAVLLHQCLRNVTNFEDVDSVDVTAFIDGRAQPDWQTNVTVTSTCLKTGEPKRVFVTATYDEESDSVTAVTEGTSVVLYMPLQPYNQKGYFFKQRNKATDEVGFKFYDTEETCENAKAMAEEVCGSDACNLDYVRRGGRQTD
ncbi:uncharacterized protein LOC144094939 [Amblyomma americanum]